MEMRIKAYVPNLSNAPRTKTKTEKFYLLIKMMIINVCVFKSIQSYGNI